MSKKTSKNSALQTVVTTGDGLSSEQTPKRPPFALSEGVLKESVSLVSAIPVSLQTSIPTGNQSLTLGSGKEQTEQNASRMRVSTLAITFNWAFRFLEKIHLLDIGVENDANGLPVCYMVRLQADKWSFAPEIGLQLKEAK